MIYAVHKKFMQRILILFVFLVFFTCGVGCERKGLVSKKYSRDFYHVPKLLPDGPMDKNPQFIIYGDSRPGWRLNEKFLYKRNWLTWKMVILPFYECYWMGNGVVGGINRLRHAPDYGIQESRMVRDAIYQEAKRSNVDFIFHGGDMATDGRRPSHWGTFLKQNKGDIATDGRRPSHWGFLMQNKIEQPLLLDFPVLPVMGNHEKGNDPIYGLPNFQAIFEYPQFYVLDSPDAAIFVVDSDFILDHYGLIDDDEQDALFRKWFVADDGSAWLERELEARNQTFKIVVMHHPPVSFAKHYKDWSQPSVGRDLKKKRKRLISMLHEQGVQLLLCSHDHLYEHNTVQLASHNGTVIDVIITGGGGAPIRATSDEATVDTYRQSYAEEGLDVVLKKQESIYHYCLVDIASDKITIRIMEVTGDPKESQRLVDEIEIGAADTL